MECKVKLPTLEVVTRVLVVGGDKEYFVDNEVTPSFVVVGSCIKGSFKRLNSTIERVEDKSGDISNLLERVVSKESIEVSNFILLSAPVAPYSHQNGRHVVVVMGVSMDPPIIQTYLYATFYTVGKLLNGNYRWNFVADTGWYILVAKDTTGEVVAMIAPCTNKVFETTVGVYLQQQLSLYTK
jgi:hypothetical protein